MALLEVRFAQSIYDGKEFARQVLARPELGNKEILSSGEFSSRTSARTYVKIGQIVLTIKREFTFGEFSRIPVVGESIGRTESPFSQQDGGAPHRVALTTIRVA